MAEPRLPEALRRYPSSRTTVTLSRRVSANPRWRYPFTVDGVVELLVDVPAIDLNAQRRQDGCTPLMLALDADYKESAKRLLKTGRILINLRDNFGESAIERIRKKGEIEIIQLALEHAGSQMDQESKDSLENALTEWYESVEKEKRHIHEQPELQQGESEQKEREEEKQEEAEPQERDLDEGKEGNNEQAQDGGELEEWDRIMKDETLLLD